MKITDILFIAPILLLPETVKAQDWQTGNENPTPDNTQATYGATHQNTISLSNWKETEFTITAGYVNKQWITSMNGQTIHENFWGEQGKRLHGMQIGLTYQPSLNPYVGLHSGLFYEAYFSFSEIVRDAGFNKFSEHNLYLPLHAMLRIPMSYDSSISIYGGLGVNWAICGIFSEEYDYYDDYYGEWCSDTYTEYQKYGRGKYPYHMNLSAEIGAKLRVKSFQLGFTYSYGLTDHNLYRGFNTRQDKLSISIGWLIDEDILK